MSINALTNDELRNTIRARNATQLVVVEAGPLPPSATPPTAAAVAETEVQDNRVTNALSVLIKYIPTEVLVLYIPTVSAAESIQAALPALNAGVIFWSFGALTFIMVMLLNVAKHAADEKYTDSLPWLPTRWPLWKMIAATIAFFAWALAIPDNPYVTDDPGRVIAGLAAIFVSVFLTIFGTIFERRKAA